jgi:hypothetical protein
MLNLSAQNAGNFLGMLNIFISLSFLIAGASFNFLGLWSWGNDTVLFGK